SCVLASDPSVDVDRAEDRVARLLRTEGSQAAVRAPARLVEIPMRYDGPDLADVAAMSKLSIDELIGLHSGREYVAYFLGFLPGWAYCGPLAPPVVPPR